MQGFFVVYLALKILTYAKYAAVSQAATSRQTNPTLREIKEIREVKEFREIKEFREVGVYDIHYIP